MLDADQNIFWLRNQFLLKIDGKTGNLLYEFDDVEDFALSNDRKKIFIFSNDVELEKAKEKTSVMAYDVQLMRPIWAKPAIIIGNIRETAIDQGKLIAITAKGFQSMDINTGEKQFSEPESLPLIKKIVPVQNGYMVIQDRFLVRIDHEGKKAWKKPLKISYKANESPVYLLEDESTVLYLTPSFANIVSSDDGSKKWEEDFVLNDANFFARNLNLSEHQYQIWYDDKHEKFPVYNENQFYIFDGSAKDVPDRKSVV